MVDTDHTHNGGTMKKALILLVAVLALTGCSATSTTASTNAPKVTASTSTPTPTPTTAAQGMKALLNATAKMTPAQQDALYLVGVRSSIPTGTDAALLAIGHKMCEDLAAGVSMDGRVADVVSAGFPSSASLGVIFSAGMALCPKP
jgi:hypothetical protein